MSYTNLKSVKLLIKLQTKQQIKTKQREGLLRSDVFATDVHNLHNSLQITRGTNSFSRTEAEIGYVVRITDLNWFLR